MVKKTRLWNTRNRVLICSKRCLTVLIPTRRVRFSIWKSSSKTNRKNSNASNDSNANAPAVKQQEWLSPAVTKARQWLDKKRQKLFLINANNRKLNQMNLVSA